MDTPGHRTVSIQPIPATTIKPAAAGAAWELVGVRTSWIWTAVFALCLAAGWSVVFTTPWGTGTGWDQAMYIGAARNLLAGNGLTIAWSLEAGKPLSHYPPLFPAALAFLGLSGLDPWDAARDLNAALRGVDLFVVALMAAWASGSRWSAFIGAFLMFTSVQMEFLHGSAWSEPLFLVLVLASLALTVRYLTHGQKPALIGAAVVVACAILTRYAGLTLVPTVVLALVCWRKTRELVGFVVLACLPLGLWVVHNSTTGGELVGDRGVAWHALTAQQLGQALFTVTDWAMPTRIGSRLVSADGRLTAGGVTLCVAIALGLGWWAWRRRHVLMTRAVVSDGDTSQRVLLLFGATYLAGVLLSMALFDDLVQLDTRILAPIYVCAVILVSAVTPGALQRAWRVVRLRKPVTLIVAIIAGGFAVRFAALAVSMHALGVMYSNTDWLASATMARLRALPANATIFTNAPDAVYMLSGRSTYEIPHVGHADEFAGVLQKSLQTARGPVVLVYFTDPNIGYRQPVPIDMIESWMPALLLADMRDGELYDIAAPGNAQS